MRSSLAIGTAFLLLVGSLFLANTATTAEDGKGDEQPAPRALAEGMAGVLAGPVPAPTLGLSAPLLSPDSEAVDADQLVTGPTLLFYFSASCSHCRAVAPEFQRLATRLEGQVKTVGVASGGNSLQELREFVKTFGLTFPVYKDFLRKFASEIQATSTPTLLLVRPAEQGFEVLGEYRPFFGGAGLLAEIRARVVLGGDPWAAFEPGHYVGPKACGGCHAEAYASWGLTHHSIAYWTLYERKRADDPACVGCHVTGMGEPSGFVLGTHDSSLVDVSCEACHGPGGPHGSPPKTSAQIQEGCVVCHDREHSVRFEAARGLPHIDHHRAGSLSPEEFRVAREDLVEGRAERPLMAFPEGENVGSDACRTCHSREWKSWRKSLHGHALKSLSARGASRDKECLRCHQVPTVEKGTKGGATSGGVGCEACHGPGEQHVSEAGGRDNIVGLGETCPECVIEAICTRCHDQEQDPDWELGQALPKVKH